MAQVVDGSLNWEQQLKLETHLVRTIQLEPLVDRPRPRDC